MPEVPAKRQNGGIPPELGGTDVITTRELKRGGER